MQTKRKIHFSANHQKAGYRSLKGHHIIKMFTNVKYLERVSDQTLSVRDEVKNIRFGMAFGTKTVNPIRDFFPKND